MAGQAKLRRMYKKIHKVMRTQYPIDQRIPSLAVRPMKRLKKRLKASDDRRGIWRVAASY